MSVELYQDEFGSIYYYADEDILELRWSAATEHISDADFRRWLKLLGQHAIDQKIRFLVVDGRNFHGQPTPETVGDWRDQHVIPLYNQAGTEKFAFLVPHTTETTSTMPAADTGPANYPTQYFSSWDAIRAWFRESN